MKYQITAEQNYFFKNNGYIEFEGLLTEKECQALVLATKQCAKTRDLARVSNEVKAILFAPRFGQIASLLSLKKELRYAFDELYDKNADFFTILQDESCIQGIRIAMMLCIEGGSENHATGVDVFPKETGNCIFFKPDVVLNKEAMLFHPEQTFLLLAWAEPKAMYVHNPHDKYTHELKRLGYVFGDRLKETTHPILWR